MLIATWLKSNTGNIFTTKKLLDDFSKNVQFTSYKLLLLFKEVKIHWLSCYMPNAGAGEVVSKGTFSFQRW